MKKCIRNIFGTLLGISAVAASYAQANANVATASSQVSTLLNSVLFVVQAGGVAAFTIAVVILGYKAIFVEGFKLSDGKGLMIGGVLFGAAAAIARVFAG